MDFNFTEEQTEFRGLIQKFAQQELNDGIEENDRDGKFPWESWKKCADKDILALPFLEQYGGCDVDFLTTILSINALGYACKDGGLVHAICTQITCGLLMQLFGSDEQKARYLPGLCSGEEIIAQAITEPGSGSDALAMRTSAKQQDNIYLVNGSKTFITNGSIADFTFVFAVTDPDKKTLGRLSCFIIENKLDGFQMGKPLEKMGLRSLQNCEMYFDDCHVTDNCLVGKRGQGAMIFSEIIEWERCLLSAANLGTLERILDTTIIYAKERDAFGQEIGKFQSISHKIASMKMNLELGKLSLFKAASLKSGKKRAAMETSICKLFISESLKKACLEAVQIHGAYGYMTEYEIERDLRDSIASTIYSGTSELQHNLISRLIGL